MKILIAEDDNVSRLLLKKHLEKWGYEVIQAVNGREALLALQDDPTISLLISDWMMPEMDGLDLVEQARRLERNRYLHIIMLTAKGEKKDLLAGMKAGADVFLTKPFDSAELKVQIRVLKRMIDLEEQLAHRLEDLTEAHRRIKGDLTAAARIQESLLPRETPKIEGIDFAWEFLSCDDVAGDMFGVFRLDEHHLGIYILDVSGHGVQAALLSVSLSHVLMPLPLAGGPLKRWIPNPPYYEIVSPAEVAAELNRRFPVMSQSNQFFTFLYGVLHLPSREFTFCRAGHTCPILIRDRTPRLLAEDVFGLPIGIFDTLDYQNVSLTLRPGDQMIFCTDGIDEAFNAAKEQFGQERIFEVLTSNCHKGIQTALDALVGSVNTFIGDASRRDDITVVGLGISENKA